MKTNRSLPIIYNSCNATSTDKLNPLFMFVTTSRLLLFRAVVRSLTVEAVSSKYNPEACFFTCWLKYSVPSSGDMMT